MENKYYIPELDEFHEGFEYEMAVWDKFGDAESGIEPKWIKTTFSFKNQIAGEDYKFFLPKGRVKVLDQQDCEELGWEHIGSQWYQLKGYVSGELGYWLYARFRKWGDDSFIKGYRGNPKEFKDETNEQEFLFSGNIRNKSEMKKLMKQLKLI